MNTGFLYGTNEIIIFVIFFALMLGATEIGFRLGRKSEVNALDKTKSLVSTLEAAILGVLGLLLGFTMSMAVSEREKRKNHVENKELLTWAGLLMEGTASWPGISETFCGDRRESLLMERLPQFDFVSVGIVYPGEAAVALVLALRVDADAFFR